jgi:hypothetical protein
MAKAGIYNMSIEQGATYSLNLQYKTEDGTPVNLTACQIRLGIKDQITDEGFLKYLDTGIHGGIVILEPEEGKFRITIPPNETAAMAFNRGVYDLEIEFPNGDIERLIKGRVLVSREVTADVE